MDTPNTPTEDGTGLYEIRIKGHLANRWLNHFENITITFEDNGITRLATNVVDQAALFGLLKKVRDVGLPLLSVNRIESSGDNAAEESINNQIRSIKGETK